MKWLLDTNVVSESVRDRPNSNVVSWLSAVPGADAAISIVTLAELRDGASTARDEAKRRRFIEWVETEIVGTFGDRTLPLTSATLIDWLKLSRRFTAKRQTRDPADLLIAATARVHSLVVVSRNARDFAGTGIMLYDPWNEKMHHMETA